MHQRHRHDGAGCWQVWIGGCEGAVGFIHKALIWPLTFPFSDLQGIRTYAKRDGSDWILNGSKVSGAAGDEKHNSCSVRPLLRFPEIFLTPDAGFHLQWLAGRSRGGRGRDEPRSQVRGSRHQLVPGGGGHEGLQQGTQAGEDGPEGPGSGAPGGCVSGESARHRVFCSSKDTAELFFEDVRLPADALLGEPNKGFYYLMNELPQVNGRDERRADGHRLNSTSVSRRSVWRSGASPWLDPSSSLRRPGTM